MPISTACTPRCSACRRPSVFETLQVYLGSAYVNDFNYLGRTYQVTAQADAQFRNDIRRHRRSEDAQRQRRDGADRLGRAVPRRHRPLSRAALQPLSRPPRSRAARCPAIRPAMRWRRWRSSRPSVCPPAFGFEWTDLAYPAAARPATPALARLRRLGACSSSSCWRRSTRAGACRSRSILIVPMCLLAAVTGLHAARHGRQHPGADRLRRAGRAGGQERDPDRRVRHARPRRTAQTGSAGRGRKRRARGCGRS